MPRQAKRRRIRSVKTRKPPIHDDTVPRVVLLMEQLRRSLDTVSQIIPKENTMSVGYTFQKFREALSILCGPQDQATRIQLAIGHLAEARSRGEQRTDVVAFDDVDDDRRFEELVTRSSSVDSGCEEIIELAIKAIMAEAEYEAGGHRG